LKLHVRKLAISASLVAGLAGTMFVSAAPAGAIPVKDNKPQVLAAVGSDTIYWLSNGLSAAYNVDTTINDADRIINVTPTILSPFPAGDVAPLDAPVNSPPGGTCDTAHPALATYPGSGEQVYDATHLPPNGSSAGVTALNGDSTGCIDLARSSRTKSASDPASDEFYAFALDALGIVHFPGSHQPANLTRAQVHDIYTCDATTHLPIIGNWNQVGGGAGVIKKYAPQTQSGSYSFFKSQFLGGVDADTNCDAAHKSIFLEEHDARGVIAANKLDAILPFSFSQWTADSKSVTPNLRNGVVFGQTDGVTPTPGTINEQVTGTPGHFNGTRYVHFVAKTTGPTYKDVMRFAGVDSTGAGFICANHGLSIIKLYGFTPLVKKATGGGVGGTGAQSFCRKNPASL
jgi:phosphate transport system substrate-binding protein